MAAADRTQILPFVPVQSRLGGEGSRYQLWVPPPAPPVAGAVEVLGVSPPPGSVIDPGTPLVFDMRSLVPIARVVASVRFAGLRFREVAYEGVPASGGGFEEAYSARSSKQTVTDGLYYRYRFSLMREEGVWLGSPELRVVAFNTDGNEV